MDKREWKHPEEMGHARERCQSDDWLHSMLRRGARDDESMNRAALKGEGSGGRRDTVSPQVRKPEFFATSRGSSFRNGVHGFLPRRASRKLGNAHRTQAWLGGSPFSGFLRESETKNLGCGAVARG